MRFLAKEFEDYNGDFADLGCNDGRNNKASFEIDGSSPTSAPSPSSFSPLLLVENISRRSFSYGKLPLEPIRLNVLKLDGSSFDIVVTKTSTVADLKQAVEAAFSHLPKQGLGKVSWSHVWGQFCLSFEGQKLLNDSDSIGLYGIREGDQLQFVRHISICYNLVRERQDSDLDEYEELPSKSHKEMRKDGVNRHYGHEQDNSDHDVSEGEGFEDVEVKVNCRNSLACFLRSWFSRRRLKCYSTGYEQISSSNSSSNSSSALIDGFERHEGN